MDRRADLERRVEALPVGGERQDHGPAAGRGAAQPRAADLDAVFAGVAAAGHQPVVGLGNTGEHVGLADLPADRGRHAVAEVVRAACRAGGRPARGGGAGRSRRAPVGASRPTRRRGRRVAGPGWRGCRHGRRRVAPRASPTWRTARVPGRRGRSAPDRRANGRVRRALRTSAPRGRRVRRAGRSVAAARRVRRRDRAWPAISPPPSPGPAAGAGLEAASDERSSTTRRRSSHDVTWAGATASGTCPPIHNSNSARACLHGTFRLGHVHRTPTRT